jgi:hypothetical protein
MVSNLVHLSYFIWTNPCYTRASLTTALGWRKEHQHSISRVQDISLRQAKLLKQVTPASNARDYSQNKTRCHMQMWDLLIKLWVLFICQGFRNPSYCAFCKYSFKLCRRAILFLNAKDWWTSRCDPLFSTIFTPINMTDLIHKCHIPLRLEYASVFCNMIISE